jgi:sulfur-oxidizing protein SoxY
MQKFNNERRTLLKGSAMAMALGITGVAQLLTTPKAFAAWPKDAFAARSMDDVMKALFDGSVTTIDSGDITLTAPDIAENGAVVPISVESSLPNVKRIIILVEDNPTPMTAAFNLGSSSKADVSTRIKMGKTSNVIALVESDGNIYATRKNVKVTIGGCGG